MSQFDLIDLHSDTATALYYGNKSFAVNDLHISLDKIGVYRHYAQVFAIFTSSRFSDEEGYSAFLKISDFFRDMLAKHADRIAMVQNGHGLLRAWEENKAAAFLAVEDARILGEKRERIQNMYDRGVRFLTLLWSGEACIGGSWDTDVGLTEFGKSTVCDCFRLGIVPDVSHASLRSTDDVIEIAKNWHRPIVATHSDSFSVYGHGRNLTDRHFEAIRSLGGLVGINLYKHHLCDESHSLADSETVYRHIERYMELGGEDTVCFGSDFDGADFPNEFADVSSVLRIADVLLAHNYTEELVRKIFWKNAQSFFLREFPSPTDSRNT